MKWSWFWVSPGGRWKLDVRRNYVPFLVGFILPWWRYNLMMDWMEYSAATGYWWFSLKKAPRGCLYTATGGFRAIVDWKWSDGRMPLGRYDGTVCLRETE